MKKIIKQYRIPLGILYCLALILTLLTTIKVDYTLIAPGYNDNIDGFIVIEDGIEETGSFSTTSVIVIYEIPYIQKILANQVNTVSVFERPTTYQHTTTKDLNYRSAVMKNDSLAKSVIVAYEKANIEISYQTEYLISTIYDYLKEDTLELEDVLISINDIAYPEMPDYTCGDTLTFKVKRNAETLSFDIPVQEVDGYCRIGVNITSLTTINDASREYTFIDNNTGGPSGGLLQSLYIFNELTEKDYTNGLDIAGTGTIKLDGTVGTIGGVEQKIITSALNGIDLFFVPASNYEAALETLNTLTTDMILVKVDTIDDCITYLENWSDNNE